MSIRNIFNRHLNLKYLRVQCLVYRKLCRQLSVQSIKYQNCPNVHHSNPHVVGDCLLQNTNTSTTKFPSWRWLLAISLFYAGYDSQSELKVIFIVLTCNFESFYVINFTPIQSNFCLISVYILLTNTSASDSFLNNLSFENNN